MSSFRIRPRFRHTVVGIQRELEDKINGVLKSEKSVVLDHLPGHMYIKIHPNEQHLWSPQLHLSFEQEEGEVRIRGLYGPNPTLWALFFFGYVAIGLGTLFIGMWGLVRWSLGIDSMVLWIVPGLWLIGLFLYFASQGGQKMGAQQMYDIHHLFEEAIGEKIKVS